MGRRNEDDGEGTTMIAAPAAKDAGSTPPPSRQRQRSVPLLLTIPLCLAAIFAAFAVVASLRLEHSSSSSAASKAEAEAVLALLDGEFRRSSSDANANANANANAAAPGKVRGRSLPPPRSEPAPSIGQANGGGGAAGESSPPRRPRKQRRTKTTVVEPRFVTYLGDASYLPGTIALVGSLTSSSSSVVSSKQIDGRRRRRPLVVAVRGSLRPSDETLLQFLGADVRTVDVAGSYLESTAAERLEGRFAGALNKLHVLKTEVVFSDIDADDGNGNGNGVARTIGEEEEEGGEDEYDVMVYVDADAVVRGVDVTDPYRSCPPLRRAVDELRNGTEVGAPVLSACLLSPLKFVPLRDRPRMNNGVFFLKAPRRLRRPSSPSSPSGHDLFGYMVDMMRNGSCVESKGAERPSCPPGTVGAPIQSDQDLFIEYGWRYPRRYVPMKERFNVGVFKYDSDPYRKKMARLDNNDDDAGSAAGCSILHFVGKIKPWKQLFKEMLPSLLTEEGEESPTAAAANVTGRELAHRIVPSSSEGLMPLPLLPSGSFPQSVYKRNVRWMNSMKNWALRDWRTAWNEAAERWNAHLLEQNRDGGVENSTLAVASH